MALSNICKVIKALCTPVTGIFARLTALESAVGLTLPVSIANGGTGAVNGPNARVNLNIPSVTLTGQTIINWYAANAFFDSLTENKVYTFSNSVDGLSIQVKVANEGAWTMTFPTLKWLSGGGVAPDAPAAGNFIIVTLTNINGVVCGVYTEEQAVL